MRIALAQMNSTIGDFAGNADLILDFVRQAKSLGADLVVFPEMSLFGYSPADLLERATAVDAQLKEMNRIARRIPAQIGVIFGLVTHGKKKAGKPFHNSAVFLVKGKRPRFFHKELLPTYDVFDEARYVEKGAVAENLIRFKGKKILVTVCEDIWGWGLRDHPSMYTYNPLKQLKKGCCDLVVNISASPFAQDKVADRIHVVKKTAKYFGTPVVYVNTVGAQDELIFDGGSFAMNAKGVVCARSAYFKEDINIVDLDLGHGEFREPPSTKAEYKRRALVLGIRDFVKKTGQERVHLGLSGGIDSAVVVCLAVEALGPEKVTAVTLPGPFSAGKSKTLAERLGSSLGIRVLNVPVSETYDSAVRALHEALGPFDFGLVNENLQARLRGLFLMALSNKEGSMLLTTGNKSEYATGYSTLYGDMCGGLAPIADLVKEEVYELAELYNAESEVIPTEIITRAPSAELRPDQKDQDSLPPYPELDRGVRRLIEEQKPARTEMEKWLMNAIARNEFKRWQAPPILKVSKRAFGRGRRFPIANRFKS